jgi:hypothetical protein
MSILLGPLNNRLVPQFGRSIRNTQESLKKCPIATRGKVEYHFKTFGALTVVFVEAKLKIGNVEERLNVVAQVIPDRDSQTSF